MPECPCGPPTDGKDAIPRLGDADDKSMPPEMVGERSLVTLPGLSLPEVRLLFPLGFLTRCLIRLTIWRSRPGGLGGVSGLQRDTRFVTLDTLPRSGPPLPGVTGRLGLVRGPAPGVGGRGGSGRVGGAATEGGIPTVVGDPPSARREGVVAVVRTRGSPDVPYASEETRWNPLV